MDVDEAVTLAGGHVRVEDLDERLTPDGAFALIHALHLMVEAMDTVVRQAALGPLGRIHCVITGSTSMQCRTRRLDGEQAVILIPLGILARTRVLARRLLWHLADEDALTINMVGSTLDERTFPWELAPDLVPVFGEDTTSDEAAYWQALAVFDARTAADEEWDTIANDIMCHCFLMLALHEMVHVTGRHDELLRLARAQDPRIPSHLALAELRRGMEVDADMVAARYHVSLHMRHEMMAHLVRKHPDVFFGRSAFAATMLFGLYDTHRKTVYDYDGGIYPHPLIRYELCNEGMLDAVTDIRPRLLRKARQYSLDGWKDCTDAFNRLEWACLCGAYGRPPAGTEGGTGRYVPISTLKYGAASVLVARMEGDTRLAVETHRLAVDVFRPRAV